MARKINRRDVLKMSGTGITITGLYSAKGYANPSNSKEADRRLPDDLIIVNNSNEELSIGINIYRLGGQSDPIFSQNFNLEGFDGGKNKDGKYKFKGDINVSGDGIYLFEGKIPRDEEYPRTEGTTKARLTNGGVDNYQQVVINIDKQNGIEIYTGT